MSRTPRKTVAVVPARAGSVGLANKNLLCIGGVPLWRLAVNQGCRTADMTIFTTDLPAISQDDMPETARFLRRPDQLATNEAPMAEALRHVIEVSELEDATLILLQPTSPFRADKDIRAALRLHMEEDYEMVLSISHGDRSVLKQGTLEGDRFLPVSKPELCFANRHALPDIYRPNGAVYVFETSSFLKAGGFPSGRMGGVVMPNTRSLDIDTADDLLAARNAVGPEPLY